jgi:hypothetical protein
VSPLSEAAYFLIFAIPTQTSMETILLDAEEKKN